MLLSTSIVTEYFRSFADLPPGALFLSEGRGFWKTSVSTALALGLHSDQELVFDPDALVCHLIVF